MKLRAADFRRSFEALGYRRTLEYKVFSKDDCWYVFDGSTPEVTHVAYLAYRPTFHAYAPSFGVFNFAAQARAVAALPSILPYLHPTFGNSVWPLDCRPCWTLFDAAHQLGWHRMYVPDPQTPDDWPIRLAEIVNRLLKPTLWPIVASSGIKALLLKSDPPFEWGISYGVLRAAEIVALCKQLSCDESLLREHLSVHEPSIVRDMYGSKDFGQMLNTFLRVM